MIKKMNMPCFRNCSHPLSMRSLTPCLPSRSNLRLLIRVRASTSSDSPDAEILKRKEDVQQWIAAYESRMKAGATHAAATPSLPSSPSKAEPEAAFDFMKYIKLASGIGILYIADYFSKSAFVEAGIKFPSSLVGMFAITLGLIVIGETTAAKIRSFFTPALDWIAKWLPLFYVASLVTLPLGLKGISGSDLGKMIFILAAGMVGTLAFTAQVTVWIRALVQTPNKEVTKSKPASPFLPAHIFAWGAIAASSLIATLFSPVTLGATMAIPFCLSCTILGFLFGNAIPSKLQSVFHPILVTALVGNASAVIYGAAMNSASYEASLKLYYSKGAGAMGAGDFLMTFLGTVILSMGFRIYDQRETMKRHAPEILGATLASSLFSFFSTALAAKALGLQALVARALISRSVTVALALPIASQFDAPLSIAAAAVLLHALMTANFGPALLTIFGYKDTIARGLAAAATGGGFGTAALTSKEPEALPFCALSYSMVGILSTILASIPQVREMIIAICG